MKASTEERFKKIEAEQRNAIRRITYLENDSYAYKLILTGLKVTGIFKHQRAGQVEKFFKDHFADVEYKITDVVCFKAGDKNIAKGTLDSALSRNEIVNKAKKHKGAFDGVWVHPEMSKEKKNAAFKKRLEKRNKKENGTISQNSNENQPSK